MLTEPLLLVRVSPAIEMGVAAAAGAAHDSNSAMQTSAEIGAKTGLGIGNRHRVAAVKTLCRVLKKLSMDYLQL